MLHKAMCFQIESEVIKNSKHSDHVVDGLVSEGELKCQLSYKGGPGVCLQFPSCLPARNVELKFAPVLFEADAFHLWGTPELGREFHKKFHRMIKIGRLCLVATHWSCVAMQPRQCV
jgi:hypothetical protein